MQLKTERCLLRPFTNDDRDRLAAIANDRRISKNLTDQFPYPYTTEDADEWIELTRDNTLSATSPSRTTGPLSVG
jgi:ribosomal-protein-alanine N-acetyltransferase